MVDPASMPQAQPRSLRQHRFCGAIARSRQHGAAFIYLGIFALFAMFGIVTIAVESPEDKVKKLAADLNLPFTWVQGKPDIIRAFGDVSAVPTLLVFDQTGKAAGAFFGAPPTLHSEAETKLAALLR